MNRIEFMAQLERLLMDIPESERSDAIAYYNDYFDEAGPEKEAEIIQELGNPGKVAATIKAGMKNSEYRGEYTEAGYQDPGMKEKIQTPAEKYQTPKQRRGAGKWALIIILIVFASPILLGVGGGIFGAIVGVLGAVIGVLVSVVVGGAGLLIGGLGGIVAGIIECFTSPAGGLVMMGSGMVMFAISLLFLILGIWCIFRLLPKLFRVITNFLSRVLHRGRGGEQA